jgi:hypothetical protein
MSVSRRRIGVIAGMSENLTKRTSGQRPVREFPARGGADDKVHLVDAAPVDVVDPSQLRTRCGAAVLEVYNSPRDVDCESCAQHGAQHGAQHEV